VGFFGYRLVIKGGTEQGLRQHGLNPAGEAAAAGWVFGISDPGADVPDDFPGLAARASLGGAAVGAYVFDSDFGWLVAAIGGETIAQLVVNEAAAREYDFDAVSNPDAFARWTEVAPVPLSSGEIRDLLDQDWTFAEEGVAELLERAGLPAPYEPTERLEIQADALITSAQEPGRPSPGTIDHVGAVGLGGYEAPLGWMTDAFMLGSERVHWRDARFVPGVGTDFLGIWDRERPGEPIRRFPRTARGEGRLRE